MGDSVESLHQEFAMRGNISDKCQPSASSKFQLTDHRSNVSRDSTNSLFSLHEADPFEDKAEEFANWNTEFGSEGEEVGRKESAGGQSRLGREEKIISELAHYQKEHSEGLPKRKRSFALIVEKMFDFAVVYSKKFGLAIVPASRFASLQQFDSICVVGQWLLTFIVEVPDSHRHSLTFAHMCLPPFELTDQKNIKTLVNAEGDVEILLNCDFSISNLKLLGYGQYVLATELGDVLVSGIFMQQNGVFENVLNVWVRYIRGEYFFWEIDAEAKFVSDSDEEIVFLHIDDGPTCSSITEQLASVDFTCDDEVPNYGIIPAELASVFTENSHQTGTVEQIRDVQDGLEMENERTNGYFVVGSMSRISDGEAVENDMHRNEGTPKCDDTVPNNDQNTHEDLTTPSAPEDFSSIYNYAKSFWPHLCKYKTDDEQQTDLNAGEKNALKCSTNGEVGLR